MEGSAGSPGCVQEEWAQLRRKVFLRVTPILSPPAAARAPGWMASPESLADWMASPESLAEAQGPGAPGWMASPESLADWMASPESLAEAQGPGAPGWMASPESLAEAQGPG